MGQGNSKQSHFNESLAKLSREDVSFGDNHFWDEFISDCQEETLVFDVLRFSSLQELIVTHPENVASIVYYTTNKIQKYINKCEKETLTQEEINNLSASIRILIKIIPPIFAHDNKNLADVIFWTNGILEAENILLHSRSVDDSAGLFFYFLFFFLILKSILYFSFLLVHFYCLFIYFYY